MHLEKTNPINEAVNGSDYSICSHIYDTLTLSI